MQISKGITQSIKVRFFNVRYRKQLFTGACCIGCLIIGMSMVTEGGMYVFQLIDYYSVNKTMLLIALSELLVISYAYGVNKYMDNLELMYGRRVFVGFKVYWAILSPIFVLSLLVFGIIFYSELTYDRKLYTYHYPTWAIGIGWILTMSSMLCIPLVAIYRLIMAKGSFRERLRETMTPILKNHQLGLK